MRGIYQNIEKSMTHLSVFEEIFNNEENYDTTEKADYKIFHENYDKFNRITDELHLGNQFYGVKDRQMILADIIEYIYFGRGYYTITLTKRQKKERKEQFIKGLLRYVNLLMSYDTLTVSKNLRKKVLRELKNRIGEVGTEPRYEELFNFELKVGLPRKGKPNNISDASKELDNYFDTLLPKTAGGLWHELLVYTYLLKSDVGNIIPLLLTQRLLGQNNDIVPPDFLIISHDKRIYGIEVGTKKEIQSGSFSLQTAIPTANIDTINSRCSDRCPICNRWIPFCDYVIENYPSFDKKINNKNFQVRCLEECNRYTEDEKVQGLCPYMKYSRKRGERLEFTHHEYVTGYHYHYQCVLKSVPEEMKTKIINARDKTALKTHYPYYPGIEEMVKGHIISNSVIAENDEGEVDENEED